MPDTWRSIAARKQEERDSRIPRAWNLPPSTNRDRGNVLGVPRECGLLTSDELRITEAYDATALLGDLAQGTLKSVDVVTAFCKRAAIAHQLTNCLTEIFFDDAVARAKELDARLEATGKPVGPLHGLPISLKDSFQIKGYDASIGIASLCFKPAAANSALVDQLLSLGAVLYVKTNVPQTLMALDSHNNVFGRTLNPANRSLTPGGSSGGEGALVAMRGSPLGVGTDVGGSIRVPAMCNGLYGVKPSHGRVPYAGQEGGGLPGNNRLSMESTAGPIALSMRDCKMFLRTVSNSAPWELDPDVIAQLWDQQVSLYADRSLGARKPLVVGIARTDGIATPHPPIHKLMDAIARTLRASPESLPLAVEVVELDISSLLSRCLKLFNALQSTEGANRIFNLLEETGEPLSPWLQNRLRRRPQKSLDDTRSLLAQKTELQNAFLSVWRESGGHWNGGARSNTKEFQSDKTLDVIICPPAPHPVPPVDSWNSVNYTGALNLLDLPAGVLPVRNFTEDDARHELDVQYSTAPPNGWEKINRELWTNVDRKVYIGSPLSIQVFAPRLQERKLVESMTFLETALQPLRSTESNRNSKL